MRIVIGSDHAGFDLKEILKETIRSAGHTLDDVGSYSTEAVDYPDFARAVAEKVASGGAERGILICGSGVGASIAANKVPRIRAAVCHDCYSARQGVEHDDMNVLTLGARIIGIELAKSLVIEFLSATFNHEERHQRRLEKVKEIESHYSQRHR
jgi:ribose 5-phosphate isomerase B